MPAEKLPELVHSHPVGELYPGTCMPDVSPTGPAPVRIYVPSLVLLVGEKLSSGGNAHPGVFPVHLSVV